MKVEILYEDADLIVCVKPYGMPTQGDKSHDIDLLSYLIVFPFFLYLHCFA